jgi:hypothetical protein
VTAEWPCVGIPIAKQAPRPRRHFAATLVSLDAANALKTAEDMILLLLRLCGIPEQRLPHELHYRTGNVCPFELPRCLGFASRFAGISVTKEILE